MMVIKWFKNKNHTIEKLDQCAMLTPEKKLIFRYSEWKQAYLGGEKKENLILQYSGHA